jgi:hypothetical protein
MVEWEDRGGGGVAAAGPVFSGSGSSNRGISLTILVSVAAGSDSAAGLAITGAGVGPSGWSPSVLVDEDAPSGRSLFTGCFNESDRRVFAISVKDGLLALKTSCHVQRQYQRKSEFTRPKLKDLVAKLNAQAVCALAA